MSVRDEVHRLVDALPESELPAIRQVLEARSREVGDSFLRFLNEAPIDDEPTTPEEEQAVAEAREDVRRGRTIPFEEVKRQLLS